MINFQKKTAAFAFLWICAALFISAYEMSFDIPGKGTITRDVELQRLEEYDKNGRLINAESARGPSETYKYDKKGRLILLESTYDYEISYEYDKKGNLIHTKDSEGYEHWYSYDEKGRLLVEKSSNLLENHYFYDENGNLAKYEVHDLEGDAIIEIQWYYYDEQNRKIHMEPHTGSAVDYTYDADGNLIGERYSDGTTIEYAYSKDGRLLYRIETTSEAEYEDFYEYEYWSNGKVKSITQYYCTIFG